SGCPFADTPGVDAPFCWGLADFRGSRAVDWLTITAFEEWGVWVRRK
ncbi:hypothetical protein A2U01_0028789, partial [Trifolium medium]|nr:hypothetical protein [Trifolium medium]